MPAKCRKVPLAQRSQPNDAAYTPTGDQVGGDCLSDTASTAGTQVFPAVLR